MGIFRPHFEKMRGQIEMPFVIVAIALASALALFVMVGQMTSEDTTHISNCKVKIGLAAGAKKYTAGLVDLGAYCPRSRVNFDNEKPEEINERIAKELYWCGDRFAFGELDFAPMTYVFQKEKLNCLVCATVDFDNPVVIDRYKKGQTFREYIVENNIPGQPTSFKSFFMTINNKAKYKQQDLQYHFSEEINPDENFVIVFANSPTGTVLTNFVEFIPGFSSFRKDIVSPAVWGKEEPYPHNYVVMGNARNILNECDNILN